MCIHEECVCVAQRYPVVMSTYLGIMGRVLLQNSSFFSSLLTQMASECSQEVKLNVEPSLLSCQRSVFWMSERNITAKCLLKGNHSE